MTPESQRVVGLHAPATHERLLLSDLDGLASLRSSRRRWLASGAVALPGLNLLTGGAGHAWGANPVVGERRIRSCIVLFLYGGPSQLETWDLKPQAPAEARGPFQSIATRVPGLHIGEHLPRCAQVADKLTIVRSVHHQLRNHNAAAAEALTGHTPVKGDEALLEDDANSFPCYGAALNKLTARRAHVPTHVALPHVMHNVVVLPGQSSGFLGPAFQPFQVTRDPNEPDFRVDELHWPEGLDARRLAERARLLERLHPTGESPLSPFRSQAFSLLQSESVRRAFDLEQEPAPMRERYGRHKLGQSLLLARRLVEAGVSFINVNDKIRNSQLGNWDSHENNAGRLQHDLLPPLDQGLSALIEDLDARGMLDSTLIMALGEFGRTPLINRRAGRDHWPDCFSVVLAGGGLRGGGVHGSSDKLAAYPQSQPVTPGDLAATLFWRFGLDPATELHDLVGRPQTLANGRPLTSLFG